MSGARTHGSLTHDDEVNAAAWAAGRGAVVGASKVRSYSHVNYHQACNVAHASERSNGIIHRKEISQALSDFLVLSGGWRYVGVYQTFENLYSSLNFRELKL